MDPYSIRHIRLLQVISKERTIEQSKMNAIYKQIFKNCHGSLDETIKVINLKLQVLKLKITKVVCEMTSKIVYVLYPISASKEVTFMHTLTLSQKEFISLVFQGILNSADGQIRTSTALNYGNNLKNKGLKLVEAEQLMTDFINNHFLMYADKQESSICFTPLTLLELESEIKGSFPDVTDCPLCKQIILRGVSCDHCYIKIHSHCLKTFATKSKTTMKCPECKKPIEYYN